MASLLFVTCNLKPVEKSRSLSLGKVFLDAYLHRNPQDDVRFLDLYRDNIQRIDADVLSGWGKMRCGQSFATLNADEQRKISRIWSRADQFIACDKCVFAIVRLRRRLLAGNTAIGRYEAWFLNLSPDNPTSWHGTTPLGNRGENALDSTRYGV